MTNAERTKKHRDLQQAKKLLANETMETASMMVS